MPNQKTLDKHFLNIAKEVATLSTCAAESVGAIIVKDERILSTGRNGTISGFKNCNKLYNRDVTRGPFAWETHNSWSKKYEVHAEMNAILYAARIGVSVINTTLYVTLSPCQDCLKNIIACGINRVVYGEEYDESDYNKELYSMIDSLTNEFVLQKFGDINYDE